MLYRFKHVYCLCTFIYVIENIIEIQMSVHVYKNKKYSLNKVLNKNV